MTCISKRIIYTFFSGDHLKLMSLSNQVDSNVEQINKMREVFDSLAQASADSIERLENLESRFDNEIADKLKALEANNSTNEQIESLETSVALLQAELKEQLNDLKKNTPTWLELNEISKPPSQRSTTPSDDTIKQRG